MDAIVLAGGTAARLGGIDKADVVVGGRTLLERALDATRAASSVVVVGPRRPTSRRVRWTREEPPGGGPVAGLAAGLRCAAAAQVVVLAVDLPLLSPDHIAALEQAAAGRDGAMFVDAAGRDQPLAAVYRAGALRRALERLGEVNGAPMRALVGGLDVARVEEGDATLDCDTEEDVERARRALREVTHDV